MFLFRPADAIILQADAIKCHKTISGRFVALFFRIITFYNLSRTLNLRLVINIVQY